MNCAVAHWTPMKEIFANGTISSKTRSRIKTDLEQRIGKGRFRRRISAKA
jgi:hypothetical protein